jgi:glucan biosynthesis protein C
MTTKSKQTRLLFLDNIKVLFTVLVIFQHARVTYAGSGWWYYIESNPIDTFSLIFFISITAIGGLFQSSLMGLFFLMGGYFTPSSYDRKGARSFWKERFIRLGIPILLYVLLINPIMYYVLANLGIQPWSAIPSLQRSFLDYYSIRLQSVESSMKFLTDMGPMWFLYVLLILTAGYTLWHQITKIESLRRMIPKELPIPNYIYLLLIAVGLGCVTFFVRLVFPIDTFILGIPFGFIIQYAMMFSVGIISLRYDWFKKMSKDHIKIWSITIAASFVLLSLYWFVFLGVDTDLGVALGGATLAAFLFAVVDNIICMGMIFIIIPIFYARFNKQGPLMRNLSTSAYHMYLIHPPILVLVSLAFASIPLIPVIKLTIVWPLTVFLCYLVSHYVLLKIRLN